MKKIKTAATHWRDFHADDVFSAAILKLIYPKIKIMRVGYRDFKSMQKSDIRFDIGRRYDPKTGNFDHHQPEGAGMRESGTPYASCGLIWKHFGMQLAKKEETFKYIDIRLIETIDAIDNGYESFESNMVTPYTISSFILTLNPKWPSDTMKNFDKDFEKAVKFAMSVLKKEIEDFESNYKAKDILREMISKNEHKNYLILEENIPWMNYVINNTNFKFVIEYDKPTKNWWISSVPIKEGLFEYKAYLPNAWKGLEGKEFASLSGINGALFCHRALHFAVTQTKKAAIEIVEEAFRRQNDRTNHT